ncbi:MAG: hypothetical protein ABI992_08785 [Chthoniobacterales bacterium]
MNEHSNTGLGKISLHGNGMGAATPEMIETRAREIALINERRPDEFTDADWDQARKELLGHEEIASADDANAVADSMSERNESPEEHGHRVPREGFEDDDESLGAHLVAGGLEEAVHDRMVEAARDDQEAEG